MTGAEVSRRLKDAGARREPKYETKAGEWMYWSARARTWIVVTRRGSDDFSVSTQGCGACP